MIKNFILYTLLVTTILGGVVGSSAFILDMAGLWEGNLKTEFQMLLLPVIALFAGLTFGLPVSLIWWLVFYTFVRINRNYRWFNAVLKAKYRSFVFSIVYGLLWAGVVHFLAELNSKPRLMSIIDAIYIPSVTVSIALFFCARERILIYIGKSSNQLVQQTAKNAPAD